MPVSSLTRVPSLQTLERAGDPAARSTSSAPARLHYLDFLRGALMFLGVLVHASHADYDLGRFEWVRFLSGSFRMACFFVISGYFTPMLIDRDGLWRFLSRRSVLLGVPALFAALVLNPPALQTMAHYVATAPEPAELALNWHLHVWFLFVLVLYTLAAPLLLRSSRALCQRFTEPTRRALAQCGWLFCLTAGSAFLLKVAEKWGPLLPGYVQYANILEPALEDLPFFGFGVLMGVAPSVFQFTHRRPAAWGVLALGAICVRYRLEQEPITSTPQHLLHLSVDYVTAFACSFALFSLARRFVTQPRGWVRMTSESAYTVYIVHYLIVVECLLLSERWGFSLGARAWFAALVALICGLAVHIWGVRRMPLLAFLLNGRWGLPGYAPKRGRSVSPRAPGDLIELPAMVPPPQVAPLASASRMPE
jgi:glucan biosynthesis protein C